MQEEILAVVTPFDANCLHTKRVYKTKRDADKILERYEARLDMCGNEEGFSSNYYITFQAVMVMAGLNIGFKENMVGSGTAWRYTQRMSKPTRKRSSTFAKNLARSERGSRHT